MPMSTLHVSLAEVLEVRAGPLTEREMWAVLCQATDALQDHFLKGEASHDEGPSFAVTLDTIMLNAEGYIQFTASSFDSMRNKDYVPPEWHPREYFSDTQIEKIYAFALGVSIYNAADHNLGKDEELAISDDLDQLLGAMCEDDADQRINFLGVLDACQTNARAQTYVLSNAATVQSLYRLVLGSSSQISEWHESDERDFEKKQDRSRTKRHSSHDRSTRSDTGGSRPRSRSRSKPRSRSRSGDRSSRFSTRQERPVPVGRDTTPEQGDFYRRYHSMSPSPYPVPHYPAYPHPAYGYDPYMHPPVMPQRRMVGEDYRGMYGPPQWRSVSPGPPPAMDTSAAMIADPEMRKAYERIKERQQKLSALKRGVEGDDYSDSTSLGSEMTDFGDRRSVISANSYTQGVYRPDLLAPYGPEKALRMGREGDFDVDGSVAGSDVAWIRRQEQEIQAMQKALENFIEKSSSQADLRSRSRQRSRTPGPSRPIERPESRQRASSEPRARSKSREGRRPTNKQPRKCYGPEFVQADSKIVSAHVPQARSTSLKDTRHVHVHLLNGEQLDMTCETSTLGRELFDAVVAHLGLPEHYLFGLSYAQEAESFFIEPDQKLSKVAPSTWKDPGKHRTPPPFTTYFRVKFYVENAAVLKHPTTKHLFYLQLRRDMLEDKIQCNSEQALTLAGLAVQAEYGDWYDKARDVIPELYLPPAVMKQVGKAHARDQMPLEHRKHRGMSDATAETRFVRGVQQLEDYGIHYYKVFRSKKDKQPIWTGISVAGILTAEQQGGNKVVTRRHPWQLTQKISFNRRRFSIKPKSEVGVGKVAKLDYYTDSYKKGRYLLKLATEHHRFMVTMRMRVEPNLADMIEQDSDSIYGEDDDVDEDYDDDVDADITPRHTSHHEESFEDFSDTEEQVRSHYDIIQKRPPSRLASRESLTHSKHSRSRSRSPDRSPYNSRPSSRAATPGAKVIGVSIRSRDSGFLPLASGPVSDTLRDRFESMDAAPGAPERRIVIVELPKTAEHGIGLTIVGGENTGKLDLGVFVKDIIPSGPAERNGKVRAGDRIIAINGQSLEGLPHQRAVELIRDSHHQVQLLLSQPVGAYPNDLLDTASEASMSELTAERSASIAPFSKPARTKKPLQASQESLNASVASMRQLSATSSPPTQPPFSRQTPPITSGRVQRTDSIDSSDLDIENVIPPEAMSPLTIGSAVSRDDLRDGARSGTVGKQQQARISGISQADSTPELPNGHMMERPGIEQLPSDRSLAPSEPDMENLEAGEEYQIVLRKVNNSLGLNVAGGVNTTVKDGGIYVKSFAENGAAALDGRIKVGDRLLTINGISLIGVTHKQAVETLRSAPSTAVLLLVRGTPPTPQRHPSTTPLTSPFHNRGGDVESPAREMEVEAEAGMADNELRSDTDPASDSPSSPEDDEDPYAFVNSDNVFKITVIANEMDSPNNQESSFQSGNTYEVDIPRRPSTGLGFSVLGGVDRHSDARMRIPRVKKVFPHGPAYEAGLMEGDVILQVNNHTLGHLANKEVMQILRTATPEAKLLICRPGPGVLPPISQVKQDLDCTLDSQASIPMATSTPTADQILNDHEASPCSPIVAIETPSPSNMHRPLVRSHSQGIDLDPGTGSEFSESDDEESRDISPRERTLTNDELDANQSKAGSRAQGGDDTLTDHDASLQKAGTQATSANSSMSKPRAKTPQAQQVNAQRLTPTGDRIISNRAEQGDESGSESEVGGDVEEDSLNTCTTESRVLSHASRRTPSPVKTFLHDAGLTSGETTPAPTPSIEHLTSQASTRPRPEMGAESVEETTETYEGETDDDATERDVMPHEFDVTLTKGEKGLGFTVAGGQHAVGVFYVKDVLYNPALGDGRIQPGDRLIAVNGKDMTCLDHREAVAYLRDTPMTVTLTFLRHDDWETSTATSLATTPRKREIIDVRSSSEDPLRKNAQRVIESLDTSRQNPSQPETEASHPDETESDQTSDQTSQQPSDMTSDTASIESQDVPLNSRVRQSPVPNNEPNNAAINAPKASEQEKQGLENEAAVERPLEPPEVEIHEAEGGSGDEESDSDEDTTTLGKIVEANKLSVSRTGDEEPSVASSFGNMTLPMSDFEEPSTPRNQLPPSEQTPEPEQAQPAVIRIELQKPTEGGLGFTLVQGEKGMSSALFVRNITPGGIASQDGRLAVGDKLLQVNGESVIGMPHNKAVALIKKANGQLHIAVSRAPNRAATPSRELDQSNDRKTPVNGDDADTDSDVDSCTLDDDAHTDGRSLPDWPPSGRTSAKTVGTEDSNEDELGDTFNESSDAYKLFLETKSGVRREELMARPRAPSPQKPQRSALGPIIPDRISDDFVTSLDVITPSRDTVHYTGRQLQITCKNIKVKLDRDDPIEEYKSLKHAKLTDNCIEARKPENKTKNRFRNVIPYDANRVELDGAEGYINASHVQYQTGKANLHYIATQGPMPETTGDFWRMVWQFKVGVIAMVTQDMEGGKVKCHRYWPDTPSQPLVVCDRYEVRLARIEQLEHFDINHLRMTDLHTQSTHALYHLNFKTWPDTGTPESGLPILQYIRLMHLLHESGPILVHCSAGIGRTGALITIDIVLNFIQNDIKFEIQKIVQDLRRQRQGMIQTKDQYRFCYKTVLEALTSLQPVQPNLGATM